MSIEKFAIIDNEQLSKKVQKYLMGAIKAGSYASAGKLPAEDVLAADLGVSRTVIRDVLINLEREGFITRRRGIGTVINKHVIEVVTRVDLENEFIKMLTQAGYEPSLKYVNVEKVPLSDELQEHFKLDLECRFLKVDRVLCGDGKPAIYCIDYLPLLLLKEKKYEEKELHEPIFDFLEQRCHVKVHLDLTVLEPELASKEIAEKLGINEGDPVMFMSEICYDIDGRPILWSKQYFPKGVLQFTCLRKTI